MQDALIMQNTTNHYSQLTTSQAEYCPLLTIKEIDEQDHELCTDMLNKQTSNAYSIFRSYKFRIEDQNAAYLSVKLKGYIIYGLMCRTQKQMQGNIKNYLYQWYSKIDKNKQERAIDRIIWNSKICWQTFLYRLKSIAKKPLIKPPTDNSNRTGNRRISIVNRLMINQSNQDHISLLGQFAKNNKQEDKGTICTNMKDKTQLVQFNTSIDTINVRNDHVYTVSQIGSCLQNMLEIQNPQQQIKFKKQFKKSSNMLLPSQQQYNSSSLSSSSSSSSTCSIQQLQLVTYNEFQKSADSESKFAGTIEIMGCLEKVMIKFMSFGFRKLGQTIIQQDYEDQVDKVKRNLELVEQNLLLDCQLDNLMKNYSQQISCFDAIDSTFQTFKTKVANAGAAYSAVVFKKLVYSRLKIYFTCIANKNQQKSMDLGDHSAINKIHHNHIIEQAVELDSSSHSCEDQSDCIINMITFID